MPSFQFSIPFIASNSERRQWRKARLSASCAKPRVSLIGEEKKAYQSESTCSAHRLLFALAAVALLATVGHAQSKSSGPTDRAITAAFAQGLPTEDIDTVDLYSGRVTVNFPFFAVAGRGEPGYSINIPISRTFTIRQFQYWSPPGSINGGAWGQPTYRLISEGYYDSLDGSNIRAGLAPGLVVARKLRSSAPEPTVTGTAHGTSCDTLTKLYFKTSAGDIEFRDAATNGTAQYMVVPNLYNRGRVWVSRGSAMTFVADADIIDVSCADTSYQAMNGINFIYPSGYLMSRDGVTYRVVNGRVVWIRDRNGNLNTFSNDGYPPFTVTDSADRQSALSESTFSQSVTYKGTGGADRTVSVIKDRLQNALRADITGLKTEFQMFPEVYGMSQEPFNPIVTTAFTLPDGRQYKFRYNEFGETARIELPTGGLIEYDYGLGEGAVNNGVYFAATPQVYRRVVERRVYESESVLKSRQSYSREWDGDQIWTIVKTRDQYHNIVNYTKHYFHGSVNEDFGLSGWYPVPTNGKEYKTERCDANGNPIVRFDLRWDPDQPGPNQDYYSTAILTERKTTLISSGLVTKQEFGVR